MRWSLIVVLMCGAGTMSAQAGPRERDDALLRNDCRLAAQVLTLGQPAEKYGWARDIIGKCDESGGPALAALWQSVPADASELKHVVYTTSRLRDGRILTALVSVAQDAQRPVNVRLSSFRVLASYFTPGASVSLRALQQPVYGSPLGSVTEFIAVDGSEPLPPDARSTILDLVRRLSIEDADATIRGAARFLKEAFEAELRTGG